MNECVYLTLTSAFVEGTVLLYTSICSLPSRNFRVFLLQVSVMFCFLKREDPGLLYVLVVNFAVRQGCSGGTSQLTSDVATSFYPQWGSISLFSLLCLSFQKCVISSCAKLFICTIYNLIYIYVQIMFKVTVVMKPTLRLAVQIWSHVSHFLKTSWKPVFCCIWHYQCPFQNKQHQSWWTLLFTHSWF